MKDLVACDLDGTLAESKQPLQEPMGEALANLLDVAHVAVISGGDWPQFEKQVASRLPERADRTKLWLMPTTGTCGQRRMTNSSSRCGLVWSVKRLGVFTVAASGSHAELKW